MALHEPDFVVLDVLALEPLDLARQSIREVEVAASDDAGRLLKVLSEHRRPAFGV